MRLSLIVAMSENGVIGTDGQLPWRLSADLRRFKQLTLGHHLILGRKTYESIGRLLPGRKSIIITRQPDFAVPGALVAHGWEEALQLASGDNEVFVIGGAEIYALAIARVDRLYVTVVHATVVGDATFTEIDRRIWRLAEQHRYPADDKNQYDYSFYIYDRVAAPARP